MGRVSFAPDNSMQMSDESWLPDLNWVQSTAGSRLKLTITSLLGCLGLTKLIKFCVSWIFMEWCLTFNWLCENQSDFLSSLLPNFWQSIRFDFSSDSFIGYTDWPLPDFCQLIRFILSVALTDLFRNLISISTYPNIWLTFVDFWNQSNVLLYHRLAFTGIFANSMAK